jgi:CRISPR-associated protein Cmr3
VTKHLFIRPIDVLYLRGNRLFGEAGDHAEALMPPWPSLFAGAVRSRILVDRGIDFTDFRRGDYRDAMVREVLGTPDEPGTFRLTAVHLARRHEGRLRVFVPAPMDLLTFGADAEPSEACLLEPVRSDGSGMRWSHDLPMVPALRRAGAAKATGGCWLDSVALEAYLQGRVPPPRSLARSSDLWRTDPRLGIALDAGSRTVEAGRLYTTDAVALAPDAGFLVGVAGADGLLPRDGLVRLGGDGRGATVEALAAPPAGLDPRRAAPGGDRFRLILATPAVCDGGWLLPGVAKDADAHVLSYRGLSARLVAAAVPRHQVVSGWDVARQEPKPAQRAVPAGAVYWFERESGDASVLSDLTEGGLWPLMEPTLLRDSHGAAWRQRRAEGFNNVWLATWASGSN